MSKLEDVCALIVTYNRKNYLIKLISAMMNGDVVPKKILIFDNNSTDGTTDLLLDKGYITDGKVDELIKKTINGVELLYFKNDNNTGGSGGFHRGIQLASKTGCKYIWAMDDDVLPDKKCLMTLLKYLKSGYKVCIPNRTDENFTDKAVIDINMSNPFLYNIKMRKKMINSNQLKDVTNVVDMPFEGPIFETELLDYIGLPKEDFFIIFDDTEFAQRIIKITSIGFVKDAILHKQIINKSKNTRLMNWKDYYGYRNQYWFDINYGKNIFVKKMRPFINTIVLILKAILKKKWSNIKILKAAYYDGTHNRLGKIVEPSEKFEWKRN